MRNRGLYGAAEGNETRNSASALAERLSDNEIIEGEDVAILKARFEEQDWKNFNEYVVELGKKGYNKVRIASIISRATCGVRI